MPKVTMSLTDHDVANTEKLRKALHARSNAHVVSIALSLTSFVVDQLQHGNEIVLRSPQGELQRIVMNELSPVNSPAA